LDDVLKFLPVVRIASETERKVYHGVPLLPRDVVKCPENFRKGDLFRGHNMNNRLLGIFEALTDVTGITDITDITGMTGITEMTGITGNNGITGIIGINGINDVNGINDAAGVTSITGITGITDPEIADNHQAEQQGEELWFKTKRLLVDPPSGARSKDRGKEEQHRIPATDGNDE
ncbi:MAG TPA: hypothetical protein VMW42_10840, partial [Desulfatiglandales bacterium]|nr:hypothetical protein [Desulfatiglandales bacterium]